MKPPNPLQEFHVRLIAIGVVIVLAGTSHTAVARRQEQQTSQAQQPPKQQKNPQASPQPQDNARLKPKKIWTNDDMPSLRSPADMYLDEKEAQKAAEAEAAVHEADLAQQVKEAALKIKLPSTVEEAERLAKEKEDQIKELQERLVLLNQYLLDAPADRKEAVQKQIEGFTNDSQRLQLELKALQDHLRSFPKNGPGEPPSVPAPSPSPQNPL